MAEAKRISEVIIFKLLRKLLHHYFVAILFFGNFIKRTKLQCLCLYAVTESEIACYNLYQRN